MALGALTGFLYVCYSARAKGISLEIILDLTIWILASSLAGSRLLFVLEHLPYYLSNPLEIIFSRSGFDFYGGFIISLLTAVSYLIRKVYPVWKFADIIVPGVALGETISQIGCFMNGCCYGRPVNPKFVPWAIPFPYLDGISVDIPLYRHPTQLYHVVIGLLIFLMLVSLNKRKSFHGETFWTYLIAFSSMQFIIEIFQEPGQGIFLSYISLSQVISLIIFSFSVGIVFRFKNLSLYHPENKKD